MKKIISLIAVTSILLMGLVSCNIEASPTFEGDLTIVVTGLPESVKALSLWGTPNEWKLANIQEEADKYIVDVDENGTATFKLGMYTYSAPLWCQFVPMTSKEMAMNDSTWWQKAFSGSGTYANAENNLVYDFTKGAAAPMKLTLDVSSVYSGYNISADIFNKRFNTESFGEALKM